MLGVDNSRLRFHQSVEGTAVPSANPQANGLAALRSVNPVPQNLLWGTALQFSMPYLKSSVIDLGLPDFVNHLIPIVEGQFTAPVQNKSGINFVITGTVNPGVIWVGSYFQVGVEAIVPINHASGTSIGAIAQLHLYLDDIFPRGIGKPLFGNAPPPG
jgi:hypothetical protein